MKISIIHPSRGRPDMAIKTAEKWLSKADSKIQYILALDNDAYANYPSFYADLNKAGKIYISIQETRTAVEAINKAVELCTGDLFIVISDDFDCPKHWDTLLLEAIGNHTDFCAKTQDGHQDWLVTLPIMDRKYYERFGYLYHPSYHHMYSDLEMTCVAWMLDKYISLPLEFKHNHPSITKQPIDAINIRNNNTWGQGKANFMKRWQDGFDLKMWFEKPWPYDELKKQGIVSSTDRYWEATIAKMKKGTL